MNRKEIINKYIDLYRNISSLDNFDDYKDLINLALNICLDKFDVLYNTLLSDLNSAWIFLNNHNEIFILEDVLNIDYVINDFLNNMSIPDENIKKLKNVLCNFFFSFNNLYKRDFLNEIYTKEMCNLKMCLNRFVNLFFDFNTNTNPFENLKLNLFLNKEYNEDIYEKYFSDNETQYDNLNEVIEYNNFITNYYNQNKNYLTSDTLKEFVKTNCNLETSCNCCPKFHYSFVYNCVFEYIKKKYFDNKQQITTCFEYNTTFMKMNCHHTLFLFNNEIKMRMYKN